MYHERSAVGCSSQQRRQQVQGTSRDDASSSSTMHDLLSLGEIHDALLLSSGQLSTSSRTTDGDSSA